MFVSMEVVGDKTSNKYSSLKKIPFSTAPAGLLRKKSYSRAMNMIANERKVREEIESRRKAAEKLAMEKDEVLKLHIAGLKFELEQRKETIL